jgi:hypothetical protein
MSYYKAWGDGYRAGLSAANRYYARKTEEFLEEHFSGQFETLEVNNGDPWLNVPEFFSVDWNPYKKAKP